MTAAFTILDEGRALEVAADLADGSVRLAPDVLRGSLGWELKPQGLCQGDVCVPVRDLDALTNDAGIDLRAFATALDRPLALNLDQRCAALGTAAPERAARLATLEAPDFTLPDLDGKPHSLSEQRGKKVLLIAYASW